MMFCECEWYCIAKPRRTTRALAKHFLDVQSTKFFKEI
jgi:hypothetical protein